MAIGVNGNSNQIDLQKLLKTMQGQKAGSTRAAKKAPGMSMNESIFDKNAQMISGENKNVSQTRRANVTQNVATVNTAKSVDGIKKAEKTEDTKGTETTKSETGNIKGDGERKPKINISDIDFGNLGSVSTEDLKSVKQDLKSLLDGDAPFFLRVPFEQKLDKVNAEIQNRNEQDGNKLSEDNAKAEEKQKKSVEEQNEDAKKDSASSASDGKAATRQTEQGTATINKTSAAMKDQASDTKAAEKKMKSDMAKGQKLLNSNEKKMMSATNDINKLSEENEQINAEIEGLSGQIETLGENADQSEIESLTQQITAKGQTVESNQNNIGKKAVTIKKFQASSGQTIRRLTKSSQKFTKTMVQNQKAAAASQQEQSKVLDIANKTDKISGYVATSGQITQYVGKGMIALGSAMITGGQALISAGMVTEKIGIGVETVGNYGKMAANITKAAVYASEGNIMGAVMSAGSAVMSGASAVKGTKEMAGGFQSVNKEGAKAAAKANEKASAKAAEKASAAEAAKAAGDSAKAEKLTGQAAKLEGNADKFDKMQTNLEGKVAASQGKQLDKAIDKANKQLDNTKDVDVDKFRDAHGNIDVTKAKAAGATKAQLGRINAENNLNKLQDIKDQALNKGNFEGLSNWAESQEKKFASKMEKAMQFGSYAMTAASQFGFMQQTPTAAATAPRRGTALPQYSTRRKIA